LEVVSADEQKCEKIAIFIVKLVCYFRELLSTSFIGAYFSIKKPLANLLVRRLKASKITCTSYVQGKALEALLHP
jgi:hypothetical protein